VIVTLDGVEIDMLKLAIQATEEPTRRLTLVRPATGAACRKSFDEKRQSNSGRSRKQKDDKLAKAMAKRNARAKKKKEKRKLKQKKAGKGRLDYERRVKREAEQAKRKKLDDKQRIKWAVEEW
jgi:hypothetical protein